MKNTLKIFWIFVLVIAAIQVALAQDTANSTKELSSALQEKLEGLKKGSPDANQQITLDGESFPIYKIDGTRVKGMVFMELMMSGKYGPEFYVNEQNEIKLCVLTVLTEEEQKVMKTHMDNMNNSGGDIENVIPFTTTDMNGKKVNLEKLKGKIVVINFWFTGCKPCVMEIPELNELVQKYQKEGIVFLALTFDPKKQVEKFLLRKKFDYQVLPDAQKIINDYQVTSFPTHLIINQEGNVAFTTSGLSSNTVHSIDQAIGKLLKK